MTLSPSRAGALWALALLTALGAAMRFASIDVQSFHHDEVITAIRVIPGSFGDMLHAVKGSESNPPLYYVLAWGWAKAFGSDEVGLRSLSALLGTATVPLAYCIGAELAHRRAGLIAAALVAVSPMLIWYSQEARSYALLVLLCAASLLFFARALRTRSGRDLALWALCSALALYSHYFAVFAVGIEALWLLVALRARWRVVLPAVAVVAAAGLALLPLVSAQVNPTHIGWIEEGLLSTRFLETGVSFLIGETGHVIAEPPRERYALLPAILFGVSLLLVAAWGKRRERRGALLGARRRIGGRDPRPACGAGGQGLRGRAQPAAGADAARDRRRDRLCHRPCPPPWPAARGRPLRLLDRLRRLRHPDPEPPAPRLPPHHRGARPPRGPRAIVTWKLAADPVRLYLHDQAQRIYSGGLAAAHDRRDQQVAEGRAVTGVPRVFHPVRG